MTDKPTLTAMTTGSMLYAEDFAAGREFPFGSWTVTEQDILEFAGQWDPLPMHIDRDAADRGPHGGLIASGLHTLVIYQRLVVEALWSRTAVVAGRGFQQLQLRRVVRPGTTLTGRALITDVTPRPDRGDALLVVDGQIVDDEGLVVLHLISEGVIAGRAARNGHRNGR
ncbi:MAG TPA: MaoC/PaaZ C-terminal domain-containing protein [Pseudonocardia sp.]